MQNVWIESYDPTIEDSYRKQIEVDVSVVRADSVFLLLTPSRDGSACSRCEWPPRDGMRLETDPDSLDTAGTEQFTAMRELYMKQGQGFLLVFSITSMSSLQELSDLREQIIRIKDDENIPLVIVGNKSDLEEDRVVSRARAFQVSQLWGNAPYYETSARRRANVDEVFTDLCRQIIRKDMHLTQMRDQELASRGGPSRYGSRRRRTRRRDNCVIL